MIYSFSFHDSASIVLPGRKAPLAAWQNDGGQNDEESSSAVSRDVLTYTLTLQVRRAKQSQDLTWKSFQ